MARGTIDDFLSKYGFSDGSACEARDWDARDVLVRKLNKHLTTVRALPFDRPGFHNGCMILLVKVKGKGNPPQKELLKALRGKDEKFFESMEFVHGLPDLKDDVCVDDLIDASYEAANLTKNRKDRKLVKVRFDFGGKNKK